MISFFLKPVSYHANTPSLLHLIEFLDNEEESQENQISVQEDNLYESYNLHSMKKYNLMATRLEKHLKFALPQKSSIK